MASDPDGLDAEARYPAVPVVRSLITLSAAVALTVGACSAGEGGTSVALPIAPSATPTASASAAPDELGAAGTQRLRLVAIGGPFTRGQGVSRRDSWPNQLVSVLGSAIPLELAANLAETSKTSQDVIDEQLERVAAYRPDVVTLQIGANDVHSPDITLDDYRRNVAFILEALLEQLPPERVFVVTTPDYTLTEKGGAWADREARSEAVRSANAIIWREATSRSIAVIDISSISQRVVEDPTLVSPNGLDPSEKQYAGWVELIAPVMRDTLARGQP